MLFISLLLPYFFADNLHFYDSDIGPKILVPITRGYRKFEVIFAEIVET